MLPSLLSPRSHGADRCPHGRPRAHTFRLGPRRGQSRRGSGSAGPRCPRPSRGPSRDPRSRPSPPPWGPRIPSELGRIPEVALERGPEPTVPAGFAAAASSPACAVFTFWGSGPKTCSTCTPAACPLVCGASVLGAGTPIASPHRMRKGCSAGQPGGAVEDAEGGPAASAGGSSAPSAQSRESSTEQPRKEGAQHWSPWEGTRRTGGCSGVSRLLTNAPLVPVTKRGWGGVLSFEPLRAPSCKKTQCGVGGRLALADSCTFCGYKCWTQLLSLVPRARLIRASQPPVRRLSFRLM